MTKTSYQHLGTLCDEPNCLTCSYYVARQWGAAEHIHPYPTYEEAAQAVKDGEIDVCLVAGAYPNLSYLIFDQGLVVRETFLMTIPPLVLVGAYDTIPEDLRVLYHHPATTPLLPETGLAFQPNEYVTSNSKACQMLLESPDDSMAITNELCAEFYGLHIFKVLRPGTVMPWICFGRAESTPSAEGTYDQVPAEMDDCCGEEDFLLTEE